MSAEAPRVMVIVAALAEFNDKSNERSARHKIVGMVSNDRTRVDSLFMDSPESETNFRKHCSEETLRVKSVLATDPHCHLLVG